MLSFKHLFAKAKPAPYPHLKSLLCAYFYQQYEEFEGTEHDVIANFKATKYAADVTATIQEIHDFIQCNKGNLLAAYKQFNACYDFGDTEEELKMWLQQTAAQLAA